MRTHGHREGSITGWGCWGRLGEGQQGVGRLGRDSLGRNAKCGWRGEGKKSTLPCVFLRNCLACSAHVPPNLKSNKKLKKKMWVNFSSYSLPSVKHTLYPFIVIKYLSIFTNQNMLHFFCTQFWCPYNYVKALISKILQRTFSVHWLSSSLSHRHSSLSMLLLKIWLKVQNMIFCLRVRGPTIALLLLLDMHLYINAF